MVINVIEPKDLPVPALSNQPAISLAEIMSALSFALDLTEGAVPGHALRSCLLGMRLGASLELAPAQMASLYYALLLKDVGCSSNARASARSSAAGTSAW